MPGGFVGRPAELASLHRWAAAATAGEPQLIFVEGAPGIGKSALVAHLLAALGGWRQLAVAGYEDEKRLPFGMLERLVGRDRFDKWVAGHDAALGGIDPFVVGAELVQLLGDLEPAGPVALIVDDAPWSDPQSLRALTFALRRLQSERVLALLTMRTEDVAKLPPGLQHYGQDRAHTIRLTGLNTDEVQELFHQRRPGILPRRSADRLREHTDGNPLHLRALFQELPTEELRQTRGPLPAPSSFGNLVLAGLAGCSEPTRQLLIAAAVLGQQCTLVQAADVGGVADPLPALEEAIRSELVDARENDDGWVVAFRHPLIRSAIYDDLGPATRSGLHARAANVQRPKELTHRIAAAADQSDPTLINELIAQSERDESLGRLSAAADCLLAAARLTPAGDEQDGRLLEAIDLLLRAGEIAEASAFADRLLAMPNSVKRTMVQARWAAMEGRHNHVNSLARTVWAEGDAAERASAAVMLAQLAVLRNDNPGAVRWAQEAARTGTLTASIADEVMAVQAIALGMSGHASEGLRTLDEAAETASSGALRATSGILRMITDDHAGAKRDLQVCVPGRPGWNVSPRVVSGLGALADVEFRSGAWEDSKRHAEQAISLVIDTDQTWLLAFVNAMAVLVPAAQGDFTEAEKYAAAANEAAAGLPDGASAATAANATVHLAACRGDALAVVAAARPLVEVQHGAPKEPGVMGWLGQYASALVALGRLEEADNVLAELAATAERLRRRSAMATAARIQGELCMVRRQPAAARVALNRAVTLGAGSATVLDQAMAQASYGGLLRRAGERRAAADRLRIARDTFTRLGAAPFLERCNTELVACGLAVDRPAVPTVSRLTPQEHAVARLVCAGKSNREVATELVISVKTVGYHLGNTYTKLGVNSRTQLAAVLGRPDDG